MFFQSIMHGMKIISVDVHLQQGPTASMKNMHKTRSGMQIFSVNRQRCAFSKPGENLKKLSPRGFTFQPQFEPAPHTRAPIVLSDGNLSPQNWKAFLHKRAGYGDQISDISFGLTLTGGAQGWLTSLKARLRNLANFLRRQK